MSSGAGHAVEVASETENASAVRNQSSQSNFRGVLRTLKPFRGIKQDFKGRLPHVGTDWRDGFSAGVRILAPSTYIFFATTIPVLAFGQQMSISTVKKHFCTDGIVTTVHNLLSTAATGLAQSIIGGQPLLIVGVSEPVTLVYGYCYTFAKDRSGLGRDLFLAWMAWVCVWTSAIVLCLAVFNACDYTNRITRLFGELFAVFTAALFLQQAIKGTVSEFKDNHTPLSIKTPEADEFQWRLSNGLWALFIAFGMVLTGLKVQQARSWRFFNTPIRSFLADYGVTLSVVVWSCLSYALQGAPTGVPRRVALPNTWDLTSNWSVAGRMGDVPAAYIVGALIPAVLISILFYFDHTVSAHMAMLDEFNLRKPSAYYYDLFLLGWMTLLCGMLGLPPVNGVLPQAPLHTKSLLTLRQQTTRAKLIKVARLHKGGRAELYEKWARECNSMGAVKSAKVLQDFQKEKEDLLDDEPSGNQKDVVALVESVMTQLPLEAQEQRLSNCIQSLLTAACLAITPGIKKMPTSVLWGYFAYIAIASLPGCEFWERFLLLFVETKRRPPKFPGAAEAPWFGHVKWRTMILFTVFQAVYCGVCYGVTWIPTAGVVFPVPILLLIPIREYILPHFFGRKNLRYLDPAPYEDDEGKPLRKARRREVETGNQAPPKERDPHQGILDDKLHNADGTVMSNARSVDLPNGSQSAQDSSQSRLDNNV